MAMIANRGYIAGIEADLDDGILAGRVINTRDNIGFRGETVSEATESFQAVIVEYLEEGKDPNEPYFLMGLSETESEFPPNRAGVK